MTVMQLGTALLWGIFITLPIVLGCCAGINVEANGKAGSAMGMYAEENKEALRQHTRAEDYLEALRKADRLGRWMSAALDDPKVCEEMKADIRTYFAGLEAAGFYDVAELINGIP